MRRDYKKYQQSPRGKYIAHRKNARIRGIGWNFTFDEWMQVWLDSGVFHLRGSKRGQYVMARIGDTGPYSKENVTICLTSENISSAYSNKHIPGRIGCGKGWTLHKGHRDGDFYVRVGKVIVGHFRTQSEAESAYKAAANEIKMQREQKFCPSLNRQSNFKQP